MTLFVTTTSLIIVSPFSKWCFCFQFHFIWVFKCVYSHSNRNPIKASLPVNLTVVPARGKCMTLLFIFAAIVSLRCVLLLMDAHSAWLAASRGSLFFLLFGTCHCPRPFYNPDETEGVTEK